MNLKKILKEKEKAESEGSLLEFYNTYWPILLAEIDNLKEENGVLDRMITQMEYEINDLEKCVSPKDI